jgi:hypothetical protein
MEPIQYKYSTFRTSFVTLFIFAFLVFVTWGAITGTADDRMVTIVGVLLLACLLFYVCNQLFFPMLRGETILEIDAEKLNYAFKDLTLYWKDIDDLDYEDFDIGKYNSHSFRIRFTMKESGAEKRISTWFIAGDNRAIFDSILNTFLKYR